MGAKWAERRQHGERRRAEPEHGGACTGDAEGENR